MQRVDKIFALCAAFLFQVTATFADDAQLKMKIVYANAWAPISYESAGKAVGLLPDQMENILSDHMGLDIEHVPVPWARAQQMVKTGAADGMVTTPTPERLAYTHRSKSNVFLLPFVAAFHKDNTLKDELASPDDLSAFEGKTFCDVLGNGWAEAFYKDKPVIFYTVPTIKECLKLLSFGRVDGIVHAEPVLDTHIQEMGLGKNIYVHQVPSSKSPLFPLLVSKKSERAEEILELFDEHFEEQHKTIHLNHHLN